MDTAPSLAATENRSAPLWRKLKIRIAEVKNRSKGADFGQSWLVIVPAKVTRSARIRKQFKTRAAALHYAEGKADLFRNSGHRAFALTDAEREDAVEALKILRDLNLTFSGAAALVRKHLRPEAGDITMQDLSERILREKARKNLRYDSVRTLRRHCKGLVEHFGHDRLVKTITRDDVRRWLEQLENNGVHGRNLKNHVTYGQQFFRYAQEHQFRADDPSALIEPPTVEWKLPTIHTVEEVKRLLRTAMLSEFRDLLPAVTLQFFVGGLRSAEVNRLSWEGIDLEGRKLEILPAQGKNRRDADWRTADITDAAMEFLLLHPDRSGKVTPPRFKDRMTKLHRAAGFKEYGVTRRNAKRHSFGSYGCKLHGPDWTKVQMGHSTKQTFFRFYRNARVTKEDAESYFDIRPSNLGQDTDALVIPIGQDRAI